MVALTAPALLAGCSMFGGKSEPIVTGSIAPPVEVQQPLPQTLAYSDAAMIGRAASAALLQAGGVPGEWVNNRTGSSGTLATQTASASADCAPFSTTVTSLSGVHQYSGAVCRAEAGTRVRLEEHGP